MRRVAIGSSAEQGSSIKITSGSTAMERAIQRRCCWPPERPSADSFKRSLTSSQSAADLNLDLSDNPDLAQPLAVITAALGIKASFTGLSTLKHKESNRILAIATELNKAGADVIGTDDYIEIRERVNKDLLKEITFDTYHDHRMAMSLAMLAGLGERVSLNNPEVVSKSYPTFFQELEKFCKITH